MTEQRPVGRFERRGPRAADWLTVSRPGVAGERIAGAESAGPESAQAARPHRAKVIVAGTVAGALLLALLVVSLRGDSSEDGTDTDTVGAAALGDVAGQAPAQRARPGIHIHPQRAVASEPLELVVEGEGCPGAGGSISITQLGTAPVTGAPDRLVTRRPFVVAPDWSFEVRPRLVGEPPGSYRVTAACERDMDDSASAVPATPATSATPAGDAARRDVFLASEMLELTPGGVPPALRLDPVQAVAGLTTQLRVDGSGCTGPAAKVALTFTPRGEALAPSPAVGPDGGWSASQTIPAATAHGLVTVQASCWQGEQLSFRYATVQTRFTDSSATCGPGDSRCPAARPPSCEQSAAAGPSACAASALDRLRIAQPATAQPATPRYTG